MFNRICSDQKPTIQFRDQVTAIPKIATQDTTLTVNNADGGKTTFPVPSGTAVDIHVAGLHYNRINDLILWGQVLMKSRSSLLEGATQIHAGAVPWGLAQRRVYPIQSRYTLPIVYIITITHKYSVGARACVGRRCEVSAV